MEGRWAVGDDVDTPFGLGRIIGLTNRGALVALEKMGGLPIAFIEDQLIPISGARRGPAVSAPQVSGGVSFDNGKLEAKRAVEALRFGVVAVDSVATLTVGYNELRNWVHKHLPDHGKRGARVCEINGAFGTGKSHTMAAVRAIAREEGYATAHVEVNGSEISLSDPESVLRQLWPTLAGKELDGATPMVDVNLNALQNGIAQALAALTPFERVAANLRTVNVLNNNGCLDENAEDLDGFLSCGDAFTASQLGRHLQSAVASKGGSWFTDPIELKRLIGNKLHERPRDLVNCLLGYAVLARRAGFKGLVITLDEFEVEANLMKAKVDRLIEVLNGMMFFLPKDKSSPLTLFIATVGDDDGAADRVVNHLVEETQGDIHGVRKWTPAMLRQLAERIHALYCDAYDHPNDFDHDALKAVQQSIAHDDLETSGHVRAFIKSYVAMLDSVHGPSAA